MMGNLSYMIGASLLILLFTAVVLWLANWWLMKQKKLLRTNTEIAPIAQMPAEEFGLSMQQRFAGRLGRMTLVSTRHSYPLVGVYPHRLVAKRFATVGDA